MPKEQVMAFRLALIGLFISWRCWLSAGCRDLWFEYSGSCYRLFVGANDFDDAVSKCQNYDAELVTIRFKAENDFVYQLFLEQPDVNGSEIAWAFIGITDRVNEGEFVWMDGTALGYECWADFEPNDYVDEDFGVISGPKGMKAGFWFDGPSYLTDAYICEHRIHRPPVTAASGMMIPSIYLDRLPIEMVSTRSARDCFGYCLRRPDCVSCNFVSGYERSKNVCVLNGATTNEYYAVIVTNGSLYHGYSTEDWLYLQLAQ